MLLLLVAAAAADGLSVMTTRLRRGSTFVVIAPLVMSYSP